MLGAGTKTVPTKADPAARLLDLSRLVSRAGHATLTGVDRVELAYLNRFLDDVAPAFALVRVSGGYCLLDKPAMYDLRDRIIGETPYGAADFQSRLRLRQVWPRKRAESDVRRFAMARCGKGGLSKMLTRYIPARTAIYNVGHSNLSDMTLGSIAGVSGFSLSVLIHDMIPLEYPQFQRSGTVDGFERRMRAVSAYADRVIYNSTETKTIAERYFAEWGRVPDGVVSLIGVELPEPMPAEIPPEIPLNRPYFVTVGTIEPRKNHALLLNIWADMFAEMPPDDIPNLFIVGSRGWNNEDVFQMLDTAPFMRKHVYEVSGLSDGGLAALIEGATALLFPSIAEGFGLPPAEAILLGTPVICGDLPIYREFLHNIPVYADTNDGYSWATLIKTTLTKQRAQQAKPQRTTLPTWSEHFNLVLKVN